MKRIQSVVIGLAVAVLMLAGQEKLPDADVRNPVADTRSMMKVDKARFTVLTPQLIRVEWSPDGTFEDRPSLVFVNRRLPVPLFTTKSEGDWFVLETEKITLMFRKGSSKFDSTNLEVTFEVAGKKGSWYPGKQDYGNLGGTVRTLDGVKATIPVDPGLISREGWAIVDDSKSPLFDQSDWPWVMRREPGDRQDLYFFGHGHEYKQALADFIKVAGRIPMPPRYVFGLWWSRYWSYTDQEFRDLVGQYEKFGIPLDVLVVDMD